MKLETIKNFTLNYYYVIISVMKVRIFNVPNILTIIRLALVPVYWIAYFGGSVWWAFGIFSVASLTDVLDGIIARKFNLITPIGKVLDPFADKLMQISAMISVVIDGKLHVAFAIIIVVKELYMIVCSAVLYKRKVVVYANIYGKLATVGMAIGFVTMFTGIGLDASAISQGVTVIFVGTILLGVSLVLSVTACVIYTVKILKQLKGKLPSGDEEVDIKL